VSAPSSEPLSKADFRALRDLVSGRIELVPEPVRARLLDGGWAAEDAGVYGLTDRGRDFMRKVPPEDLSAWYAPALFALAASLFACDPGPQFQAAAAALDEGGLEAGALDEGGLEAGEEHLDAGGAVDARDEDALDAGGELDARDEEHLDAGGALDARDEEALDAGVPLDARDEEPLDAGGVLDARDEEALDAGVPLDARDEEPLDAGPMCPPGQVMHVDGMGQTFCDAVAIGTYSAQLLKDACAAFAAATPGAVCAGSPPEGCALSSTATVSTPTIAACIVWSSNGHVRDAGSGLCACPAATDPAWY